VFRVHFTAADIARTCIAPPPGPLAEAVFSLDALRRPGHDLVIDGWRERMELGVRTDRSSRLLAELLPRISAFDLIALGGPVPTLDEALDRNGETNGDRHGAAVVGAHPPGTAAAAAPNGTSGLPDRNGAGRNGAGRNGPGRDQVAAVLRRWFRLAVAPYWTAIRALLESERRRLTRLAGERGVEVLLATLHPSMRWQAPVLLIQAGATADHDCYLDGRGLTIVPSLFCPAGHPVCRDPTREAAPLVLYYPAVADPFVARTVWATGNRRADASLVALLGKTRARILQALGEDDAACSTTDLAARAGVAVSSASEHATVLRQAGLVDSRRHRSTVFHRITGLGVALLDAHRHPRR
jgi:DNA-binding transcriptional ArsR family regulator